MRTTKTYRRTWNKWRRRNALFREFFRQLGNAML